LSSTEYSEQLHHGDLCHDANVSCCASLVLRSDTCRPRHTLLDIASTTHRCDAYRRKHTCPASGRVCSCSFPCLRVHHGGIRHWPFPSCRLFDVSMSGEIVPDCRCPEPGDACCVCTQTAPVSWLRGRERRLVLSRELRRCGMSRLGRRGQGRRRRSHCHFGTSSDWKWVCCVLRWADCVSPHAIILRENDSGYALST
jgi:hypothetical protein